jgi:hypothetical protein
MTRIIICQESAMTEIWFPVRDWEELYEVSSCGRARSLPRQTRRGLRGGNFLKLQADRKGYLYIAMSREGEITRGYIHQLVCEAVNGPCPDEFEARHLNGENQDNSPSNLEWGTKSENMLDSVRHGTHRNSRKERCPKHGCEYFFLKDGRRNCRKCARESKTGFYDRNKEAILADHAKQRAQDPEHRRHIERESKRRIRAKQKEQRDATASA